MYWKTTIFTLGLAAGLTLHGVAPSGSSSQDQGAEPESKQDKALAKRQASAEQRLSRNVETLRQMQGGWFLSELRSSLLEQDGRQDVAYMVVAEEFMALEIHMGYFNDQGQEEGSLLQSGLYRLNFNVYSDLIATVLIGTIDLGEGQALPRDPGIASTYEVEVGEGILTMTSEDGSRFVWTKLATGPLTNRLYEELDWLAREPDEEPAKKQ